jgi:signal transduction histidine kinase
MAEKQKVKRYQERLRALTLEMTLAEARERRRIAADLHDGIAQMLALIRIECGAILNTVSEPEVKSKLADLSGRLKDVMQEVRGIVHVITVPSMHEIGLAAAIGDFLEDDVRRHGLRIELINRCGRLPFSDDVRVLLFRNTRELLMNVIRHAKAGRVVVSLWTESDQVFISVEDDGIGFAPGNGEGSGNSHIGFGLFSIRERMSDLGGSLDISAGDAGGCRAVMALPLYLAGRSFHAAEAREDELGI